MIHVRNATEDDAQSLADLNHAFNGVKRASHQMRSLLQSGGSNEIVLVAEEDGMLVGFACYQKLHSICYDSFWTEITELYVSPGHRSRGAAKALVREAIRQAEEAGAFEILLRTNMKNEAAKRLLTQLGLDVAPHCVFRKSVGPA